MTPIEKALAVATLVALAAGGGVYALTRQDRPPADSGATDVPSVPAPPTVVRPPGPVVGEGPDGDADPGLSVLPAASGGVRPGLRAPFGEDLSDPAKVMALVRDHLAQENPRWDWIAGLLAKVEGPLDADIKEALLNALVVGNAAGAIQALERVRDGSIVPDLLRRLDDPQLDDHDRANLLVAVAGIPGADLNDTVTGLESRLVGDVRRDGLVLVAIARLGGVEAARALAEAASTAADPSRFGPEIWRHFDLRRHPDAAEYLASVLRAAPRSEAGLVALLDLAGRPGATEALVGSILALDAPEQREPVRRSALVALAKTGDPAALERLIAVAEKQADYASVAARAVGQATSLSEPATARLLQVVESTSNEYLRQNAVEALGASKASAAVPTLTKLVADGTDLVQRESVRALGRIGAAAASSVQVLASKYGSGDEAMRQQVALALAQIATDEAMRVLEQARATEASPLVKRTLEGAWQAINARRAREPK